MLLITVLRKTGTGGWEFKNEALLEDCLQRYLQPLLGLKVIAQQHSIQGQICDLVAVSEAGQLAILELKNQEDRYIVQQLTRYLDAFLEAQPFADNADYSQPIRLIAIAPSFHRDNFVDRKYSQVQIEFLTFEIQQTETEYSLKLSHLDTEECSAVHVSEAFLPTAHEIPSPPKSLLSLLRQCPEIDRDGVLRLRQQLLSFDQRIREITSGSSVLYGNGKSNLCAEVRYDSKRERAAVFLWLRHATIAAKRRGIVARMRIWTDWVTVSDLAHVPKGNGRAITVDEWRAGKLQPLKKLLIKDPYKRKRQETDPEYRAQCFQAIETNIQKRHSWINYRSGLAMTAVAYRNHIKADFSNQIHDVIELVLDIWLSRL
ncbi:MAG: DUF91 domain-containing protein [Leptolyngbya sp. RL_3_1]|nr:DUF91 domain-containing protein [Leptolyngbya sp. RL_3_1]